MHFRLLGAVQVTVDGHVVDLGGWQRRALIAMLLLHANRTVAADRLMAMLWPSGRPRSANRNLQVRISQLRRLLTDAEGADGGRGGERLVFREPGYRLRVCPGELDLHRFEHLADHGRQELAAGRTPEAARLLGQSLRLWHGDALEDVQAGAPVLAEHRARLEQRRLAALEDRIQADLALGRHADLVGELTALVADHPLRERLRAQLMLSLHGSGRTSDALAAYRDAHTVLRRETGLEPGPDLRHAERTIVTVSAPAPARSRPSQLPADTSGFTGRTADLARLDALLGDPADPASGPLVAVISGPPGVGKTALAVHWAHRVAARFPDGQLYLNLRGFDASGPVTRPEEAVCGLLEALDVPAERVPVRLQAQIGLYRGQLNGRRMLVLLDNARDVEQVRPLLPASPGCLVVVTSRCELPGLTATAGAHPVTVDVLGRDEAADLLAQRLGDDRLAAAPAATERILDLCAGLPLAVAIVAARAAARPGQSLDALTAELRGDRDRLDAFATGEAATDLRTVFSWSCSAVSEPAARLFRLLGVHPATDLGAPAAASVAGLDPDRTRALLAELTRAHLLTEPTGGRYSFHDLLRAYAAELSDTLDTGPERRAALRRLVDHYCVTAHAAARLVDPGRDPIDRPDPAPGVTTVGFDDPDRATAWFAAESHVLPAVVECAARAGFDAHVWPLAWALTHHFDRQGRRHDWLAVQEAGLAAARRLGDRAAQAHALRGLGRAHGRTGHDDEALRYLRQALRLHVELGDPEGEAHARIALAWITGRRGWMRSALMHAERALSLFRRAGHTVGEANALNSVGFTRAHLGQVREGIGSCRQALMLLRGLGDRAGEASAWDSIGFAYHRLGEARDAIDAFRRALDIQRDIGDHQGEAETLIHLGDALLDTHDDEAARWSWRRAAQLRIELDGP